MLINKWFWLVDLNDFSLICIELLVCSVVSLVKEYCFGMKIDLEGVLILVYIDDSISNDFEDVVVFC